MLLVLDNCEHVIEAAAALAVDTLRGAPGVRVLTTSREPLRTEGEHVHRLSPLESPPTARQLSVVEALNFPADCSWNDEFELTDADAAIVAEICENWTEFRLRSSLQQPASRSPRTTTWSRQSRRIEPCQCRENGQIGHSTTVRAARGCR